MAALQPEKLATVESRVKMAMDTLSELGGQTGDSVYLGVGHGYPWTANDTLIPVPLNTIDYSNQVHRDLVALKKLSIATASLVVRRHDWAANTYIYDPFDESTEMFSTIDYQAANGTVNVANSNFLTGKQTTFLTDFANGDFIQIEGDNISTLPVNKEIIAVLSDTRIQVNSAVSGAYVNSAIQQVVDTSPNYAKNFYTRNSYDQVFVCLDNNNGSLSTQMPQISLGGQLPTNPYIITADGYKWKYLYTMSSGQKKLFFTSDWMPVGFDAGVHNAAVDGRIDIIDILSAGRGYNSNVAACNAPILVLVGDGTGANLSAQVDSNGSIIAVNILSGGQKYTTATLTANTGANGAGASFDVKIGPRGGWGSNVALELGATNLMISTSLSDTESGTIPIVDVNGEFFTYRQLSLILNPTLKTSGNVATNTNYDTTIAVQVSPLGNNIFRMGDIAYQNFNNGILQGATFFGTVVWYDSATQELHLNNLGGTGTFTPNQPIKGVTRGSAANAASYITAAAFTMTDTPINTFSGVDLYIENVPPIQRFPLQVEEIRLIISF